MRHIEIWNVETGEIIKRIDEAGGVLSLAYTPDGRRMVAGCAYSDAQIIKVFDGITGREL
jgi:WD40 repeat protein